MACWFTSDHHFGHTNIIKYENGPWSGVDDMELGLVERWNEVVAPEDTVYHLGDFALANKETVTRVWSALHGKKFLIRGNHDRSCNWYNRTGVTLMAPGYYRLAHRTVWLCHDPMAIPAAADTALYGHIHGKTKRCVSRPSHIHVGVDAWDYYPVS